MKLFSKLAYALSKYLLDEHVNVLAFGIDGKTSVLQILKDSTQTHYQTAGVLLGNYPAFGKHFGVSHAALNVLPVHPRIEPN